MLARMQRASPKRSPSGSVERLPKASENESYTIDKFVAKEKLVSVERIDVKPLNALELDREKDDEIEFERDSESNEVDKMMQEDPQPRQVTPTKLNNYLEPGISQSPRIPNDRGTVLQDQPVDEA